MCFEDISRKLGSQMWVRILFWFGGRFGVPFGSLLGAFWGASGGPLDHVGTLWGSFGLPLGPLGGFSNIFQYF